MAGTPLKIVVFLGSVREGRIGQRVAKFMMNQLTTTGHEATLFGKPRPSTLVPCKRLTVN